MLNVFICLLVITGLLVTAAKASLKLFLLTGTISGKNGEPVSLVDDMGDQSRILCSVNVQNNGFRLSCQVPRERQAYLIFGKGKQQVVYPVLIKEGHFSFSETESGTIKTI